MLSIFISPMVILIFISSSIVLLVWLFPINRQPKKKPKVKKV